MNKNPDPTPEDSGVPPAGELPEVMVEKSRGLSIIWLIPIVAALIGAWLAYDTYSKRGPAVTIVFKDASGLEAGKTKVKYKSLDVGTVENIKLSNDLSQVTVTVRMAKDVKDHLREKTDFWVVQPQLGLTGISGLETVFSGTYIAVAFGGGKPTNTFTALDHPPLVKPDTPGRQYVLRANNLGSLRAGVPVYFRDIQVGQVLDTQLAEDKQNVIVQIFVNAPYDRLVHNDSRFWKASGIDISLSAQGISVRTASLLSLIVGGVAFDTPSMYDKDVQPSPEGTHFKLYGSFASIGEEYRGPLVPFMMYFTGSMRGLNVGAPVEFRGIKVGSVTDLEPEYDSTTNEVRIPVFIEIDAERVVPAAELKKIMPNYKEEITEGKRPLMEKLVERGLRAQLKTGSLLTGQLYVDLDFYPDSPPRKLIYGGKYPEVPTVPSTVADIEKSATDILAKLKALPLDKIGNELLGTVQGTNRVANDPELKDAIRSLNATLKDVQKLSQSLEKLSQSLDKQLVMLASSTEKTLSAARTTLESVEPGSPIAVDLTNMLEELSAAARSIRILSDYLDRHPDALLYGKSGAGAKP